MRNDAGDLRTNGMLAVAEEGVAARNEREGFDSTGRNSGR